MVKTLQQHGNSLALVLDKPILEMIGADEDTELQLTVSNGSLIVTPVNVGVGREKLEEIFRKLQPRYGDMLRRLAK
jgi:antitoxin component of MazEF toxin-antitoxin module